MAYNNHIGDRMPINLKQAQKQYRKSKELLKNRVNKGKSNNKTPWNSDNHPSHIPHPPYKTKLEPGFKY